MTNYLIKKKKTDHYIRKILFQFIVVQYNIKGYIKYLPVPVYFYKITDWISVILAIFYLSYVHT